MPLAKLHEGGDKGLLFKEGGRMSNIIKGRHQRREKEIPLPHMISGILAAAEPVEMKLDKVYEAFHTLSKKYPEKFQRLYFQIYGGIPYSAIVEDTLSHLGNWGIVLVGGPRHRSIKMELTVKKHSINAIKKRYGVQVLKEIQTLAKEFSTLLTRS